MHFMLQMLFSSLMQILSCMDGQTSVFIEFGFLVEIYTANKGTMYFIYMLY